MVLGKLNPASARIVALKFQPPSLAILPPNSDLFAGAEQAGAVCAPAFHEQLKKSHRALASGTRLLGETAAGVGG